MEYFLNIKRKRPSHENERKIVPKAIVQEPPVATAIYDIKGSLLRR